nr:hypothetical protein Itr_chr13CG08760 [Ipomoea trifida]
MPFHFDFFIFFLIIIRFMLMHIYFCMYPFSPCSSFFCLKLIFLENFAYLLGFIFIKGFGGWLSSYFIIVIYSYLCIYIFCFGIWTSEDGKGGRKRNYNDYN